MSGWLPIFQLNSPKMFDVEAAHRKHVLRILSDESKEKETSKVLLSFLVLFFFSILVHLKSEFLLSWDLVSYYLPNAKEIANSGLRITLFEEYWSERLAFELLLSLCYLLPGDPYVYASLMIGIFGALYITLGALLAQKIAGNATMLMVAPIVILSPNLIFWAPRHIDAFWPLLLFLSLYLLLSRSNSTRSSISLGIISGFVVTVGMFAKEVVFLFLPVYLLLWFLGAVSRDQFRLVAYYATVSFGGLLWYFYFSASPVSQETSAIFPVSSPSDFFYLVFSGANAYYTFMSRGVLSEYFSLTPLFFISTVYCFLVALFTINRRECGRPEKVVAVCIVCFLPFDVIIGLNDLRVSQNLFSVMLLYIALGLILTRLFTYLILVPPFGRRGIYLAAAGLAVIVLLLFQLNFDKTSIKNSFGKSFVGGFKNIQMSYRIRGAELYANIVKLAPQGANILIDYKPVRSGMSLIAASEYQFYSLPLKGLGYQRLLMNMGFESLADGEEIRGESLLLSPQRSAGNFRANDWIAFLPFDDFYRFLVVNDITYIVLPEKTVFNYSALHDLLSAAEGVTRIGRFFDSRIPYVVYSLEPGFVNFDSKGASVLSSKSTLDFLRYLEREEPNLWKRYQALVYRKLVAIDGDLLSSNAVRQLDE